MPVMKIIRVTVWEILLESHETYYMAGGKTCEKVPSIILRAETDCGICGWSEVCPIPHYLPAYAGGVKLCYNKYEEYFERRV